MSDEFIGGSDQGTGDVVEQPIVTAVEGVQDQVATDQTETPLDEKSQGILRELQETREKLKNKEDYINFLKNISSNPQQGNKVQMPELDDDSVPYVQDVKALIKAELERANIERETNALVRDITSASSKIRETDTMFDSRMDLAKEILRFKPEYEVFVNSKNTAEDIIKAMEMIAQDHPLYNNYAVKPAVSNKDIIDRLNKNSQLPATVTGLQGSGGVDKLPSQMTDEEYFAFKESVKKRA